jgi:pimeloyl-ACP methyl ester carboxylesterase
MTRLKVQAQAVSAACADDVWAVVQDFAAPWHPAIAQMTPEQNAQGQLIRAFTVKGDDSTYRERLTYYSASERTYAYTHLAGIAGVTRYDARLTVRDTGQGAEVTMQADLTAPSPRAEEIAAGTKAIFADGTKVIARLAEQRASEPPETPAPAPTQITETIIISDPSLALSVAGPTSDTLCLFLHGIGGQRSNWHAQLVAIAPYCHAAALDLRGYGDSALGAKQSTVEDYCADILRVMDHFGAKTLILCGLSYGAWIATSFAMRYPEKLRALVLSGGCTGMSEATPEARAAFLKGREAPLNAGQTPADFAPAVVEVIAGPQASAEARKALHQSMAAIPSKTYADALRCFTNPAERFDFARLTLPVLMMTGEHDRLAPPAEIRSVAQRIFTQAATPDVRFEVIKDAGHVCNLEQPETYNAILTDFITRILP